MQPAVPGGFSRRALLAGAVGGAGAFGAAAGVLGSAATAATPRPLGRAAVPFHGTHQAGILQPQRHEASGLYVVPPGAAEGGYVGQGLLG